ncbi:hypothetical protein T05_12876 [Trichinella murrelli]|uniref:Uncharacterized protein n=1 Tax=Trichinella murrelli TaxID=144512 RepID=A0A0V0SUV9_9BILA|nr:hypothetical protein T05_12876 [Trichinella murrelli]
MSFKVTRLLVPTWYCIPKLTINHQLPTGQKCTATENLMIMSNTSNTY